MHVVKRKDSRVGFMTKLADIMEDPEFRGFVEQYFSDIDVTKTTIMMMKTYSVARQQIMDKEGKEPDKKRMISVMKDIVNNSETRALMVESMDRFMRDDLGVRKERRLREK
jgi:hypothetical protein